MEVGSWAWAWWWRVYVVALTVARARELDPAACAARFDLQRDKIIRTEESREMGARYLSELDVGARAECLRLCCETDACDVFVYEEKGPGSCYLFNCGPPEDFRCKFTAHSNFSSGVLALSRRLAELQDQEQLAHHERELASLRSASTPPPPPPPPLPPTSSTTTPAAPPPHSDNHPLHSSPPSRCSRYQFECRVGGECIAVYNACDGVAQCADGSDEAPELGCPTPPTPPPPPASRPAAPPQPPRPQHTLKPVQEGVELGASGGGGDALGMENQGAGDRWPHRLTQAQPQHRYNEPASSSHIFSHKGGLLQEAEPGPGAQYPPFEPPWPRRTWTQQQNTGMESLGGWGNNAGYSRLEWGEPEPHRAWPVPQPRPDPEPAVYMPSKTMPEIPVVYSSQQQTLRDGPKKGLEVSGGGAPQPPAPAAAPRAPPPPAPTHPAPATDTTTTAKQRHHDKSENGEKSQEGGSGGGGGESAARPGGHEAAERHLAPDDHDGLSERPPAAVLLLVLGVVMTGAMGAMLGCRATAARRRLRRGKPFAHDADYLVNGMYL